MNRHVIVCHDKYLPVINVWWGPPEQPWPRGKVPLEKKPDLQATRIWMAASPADETGPDYACVIAEVYDSDPIQRDRKKVMLDEAIGLDPSDFSPEELERFQIRQHEPSDDCGCPLCAPTLGEFRRGLVALKDLYHPELLLVPGTGLDWQQETYEREMGTNRFFRQTVMTEGLQKYDTRFQAQFDRWFPFQCGETRIGVLTVSEDEVFDKRIVEHHLKANLFYTLDYCRLFSEHPTWHPIVRAVQLALARMQDHDLTFTLRAELDEGEISPGYTEVKKKRTEEQRLEDMRLDAECRAALAMIGGGGVLMDALDEDDL